MYNEDDWMNFRADAIEYVTQREVTLLKDWMTDIGYKYPIGYYRNISKRTMEIYSTRIGLLIGKAGVNVTKLEEMLKKEFHGKWKVKFIEIRGGFIGI